jgi:hypothetical protein
VRLRAYWGLAAPQRKFLGSAGQRAAPTPHASANAPNAQQGHSSHLGDAIAKRRGQAGDHH